MKKTLSVLLLLTLLCLSLFACGQSEDSSGAATPEAGKGESVLADTVNRKIVYTVELAIKGDDVGALKKSLTEKSTALGGYVEYTNENYDDGVCTYAFVTYRIPTEQLDAFIGNVEGAAKLTDKNVSTTDITEIYVDAQSEKASLESRRAMLEDILDGTDLSAADRISVINEIAEVNTALTKIELLIRDYDSRVGFSTVTVRINETVGFLDVFIPLLVGFLIIAVPTGTIITVFCVRKRKKNPPSNT